MPAPLSNFRAPVVRGGVGRDVSIPWTSRDDALLLLGVYPLTRTLPNPNPNPNPDPNPNRNPKT